MARALGVLGADILQVTVLERETGRAVDEFIVSWPGAATPASVRDRLSAVPGTRVEGVWPTREVPGSAPDHDLLLHVATDPARGLATMVDALPSLCGGEWALALADGVVRHSSPAAPLAFDLEELPPRATSLVKGEHRLMVLPVTSGATHVVVARCDGPPFHRAELDRTARIVEIVSRMTARFEPVAD
ncbi:amino acid-binding protein [Nonomuraea sp. NPDC059194]|uniref:amino acid-binding protein n=1 Tax=Nonomuraea sp. NPDC059194 TaxID=3346764 RepID=UPI00368664E6